MDKVKRYFRMFKIELCLSCSVNIKAYHCFSHHRNYLFLSYVRYDSDANHEPCFRRGHRAHWLLVHGYLKEITMPSSNEYDLVLAKHGKSKLVSAFSLMDLFQSNGQLIEADPKRRNESEYCVPQDGSLQETLCNFFIAI